jgi:hypothetical protein
MRQLRSSQLNSTKFSTNYLVLVGHCILDRWGTGASRPRCALARDFVNFENNFIHRARVARPHGFDISNLLNLESGYRSNLKKIAKLNVISRVVGVLVTTEIYNNHYGEVSNH